MNSYSALEKFYEWRQAQATGLAKGAFTLAGLILSPLLAALLNPKAHVPGSDAALFLGGAYLAAITGVLWYWRATQLHNEFRALTEQQDHGESS